MRVIILDPGHGGTDPGAINDGFLEASYNLEMANLVKHSLWASIRDVHFTRESDDINVSLKGRGALAEDKEAGLVVSIHTNSVTNEATKGAFVFYWPGNPRGNIIAQKIVKALPANLRNNNSVQAATKNWENVREVLRHHPSSCISILVECGFCSNKKDREYLKSYWGKRRIAHAIASGILFYCEEAAKET